MLIALLNKPSIRGSLNMENTEIEL